jgi:hypothetical protein
MKMKIRQVRYKLQRLDSRIRKFTYGCHRFVRSYLGRACIIAEGTDCDGFRIAKYDWFWTRKAAEDWIEDDQAWADGPMSYNFVGNKTGRNYKDNRIIRLAMR